MQRRTLFMCLFLATASILNAQFGGAHARVPKGLYTNFLVDDAITAAQKVAYGTGTLPNYPNPALKPDPTDAILVNYFSTLLSNPGVSGLAPMIQWKTLNPNNPGWNPFSAAPGAYAWNALDDVFTAVDRWNKANPSSPKNVQLILSPGFNSPSWVWNDIDMSVCGKSGSGCGSCDGLFLATPPVPAPSHLCGYTLLFEDVEEKNKGPFYTQFPLPWNPVYQADYYRFLIALNQHLQQEPSNSAFVAITVAGPTASSSEMILPTQKYWPAVLTLPVPQYPANATIPNLDIPTAWNLLFKNGFGPNPNYQNSDLAIVEAWKNAIDAYSLIFSGITLELVSTGDALPEFNVTDPSLLLPAPGFEQDCDDPTNNLRAMDCAADTQVIAYFTNPLVGGNNAKLTFEAGMLASSSALKSGPDTNSFDIGQNGIKWLAATTASGTAPLPGTPFRMSRMLGGLQFDTSLTANLPIEGCPNPPLTSFDCSTLNMSQGFNFVMALSYFPGTPAATQYTLSGACSGLPECYAGDTAIPANPYNNFHYGNAPMNMMEDYDGDILFAMGLGNCNMEQIAGNPSAGILPDVSGCINSGPDINHLQSELVQANTAILSIAEGPSPF